MSVDDFIAMCERAYDAHVAMGAHPSLVQSFARIRDEALKLPRNRPVSHEDMLAFYNALDRAEAMILRMMGDNH